MAPDTYNPQRDVTAAYLATVRSWIKASGEVLVILRYLRAAGAKDFALITSAEDFDRLIAVCPTGTDIIVFREKMLPLRGIVNEEFKTKAKQMLPEGSEYLFVKLRPEKPTDLRCFGDFDYAKNMDAGLEDIKGEAVALGVCPDFLKEDDDSMISASKGGIDGPR